MGQKNKGMYQKFIVKRTDGKDGKGEKHDGCEYFVLDLTHDKNAIPALLVYADVAEMDGYELLATDIRNEVARIRERRSKNNG